MKIIVEDFMYEKYNSKNTIVCYVHINNNKMFPKTISWGFYRKKIYDQKPLKEFLPKNIKKYIVSSKFTYGINYRVKCINGRYTSQENIDYARILVEIFTSNGWVVYPYFNNKNDIGIDFFKEISIEGEKCNLDVKEILKNRTDYLPIFFTSQTEVLDALSFCRSNL